MAQPFRPQPRQSPGVPPPIASTPRVSTVPQPNRIQPSLNQRIAGTYWDLRTAETTSHEEAWYKERKAVLVGHNMYEGSVKPLRDHSSSYIS